MGWELKVDSATVRTEVAVEAFPAAEGHMWIELVEGLQVKLVAASDHERGVGHLDGRVLIGLSYC